MGFGCDAYTKYAMLRLLFLEFVKEFEQFAVLHVSYDGYGNMGVNRFCWTNQHLFTEENATGFILLNESHMMSMRKTDNQVVILDTNLEGRLDGFCFFLHRTCIFGRSKIVIDEETPQQEMGHGGCVAMSFVNALLPDGAYATQTDAEVMKLPYIEKIFDMIVDGHCSPYDLAPEDWRHKSLGLLERGPFEPLYDYFTYYDEATYNAYEANETESWAHFACFRLNKWILQGSTVYNPVTQHIMRLYFQGMYDSCINTAPSGADLDDINLYADLWARMKLVDRAVAQREAEFSREEYEQLREEYEEMETIYIQDSIDHA